MVSYGNDTQISTEPRNGRNVRSVLDRTHAVQQAAERRFTKSGIKASQSVDSRTSFLIPCSRTSSGGCVCHCLPIFLFVSVSNSNIPARRAMSWLILLLRARILVNSCFFCSFSGIPHSGFRGKCVCMCEWLTSTQNNLQLYGVIHLKHNFCGSEFGSCCCWVWFKAFTLFFLQNCIVCCTKKWCFRSFWNNTNELVLLFASTDSTSSNILNSIRRLETLN